MTKNIKDLFDLSGKTAVITGGSRGLGKEMAEGLAEAGANLMLCARRDEWLEAALEPFRADGLHSAMYLTPILAVLLALVLFAASRTVTKDMEKLQSWMRETSK